MSPDDPVASFVYLQLSCLDFMLIPVKHLPPQAWVGYPSAALPKTHVFPMCHRIIDSVSSYSTQPRPWRDRASLVLYLEVSKQGPLAMSTIIKDSPLLLLLLSSFTFAKTGSCHLTQSGLKLLTLLLSAGITAIATMSSFGFFSPEAKLRPYSPL